MPVFPLLVVIFILSIPIVQGGEIRYCGSELVGVLELVCGGQFFGVARSKRSQLLPISSVQETAERDFKELTDLKSIIVPKRGGVSDECCVQGCTFETLQSYCLVEQTYDPSLFNEIRGIQDKIHLTTLHPILDSATLTTTVPQVGSTPHAIRSGIRTRRPGRWFYVQSVGVNPTRLSFPQM